MECDKELDFLISQALLEVERYLSLPNNSLVGGTPSPKISGELRPKKMRVHLDQNFMARVPEKLIRHSKEFVLRRIVAEQQETIALLMNALDFLLEQEANPRNKTAPLGATTCHKSNDQ